MIESILIFLLWLLVYALVAYVVVWIILLVLGLFFTVPPKIAQLLYAIAGLLVLIWAISNIPKLKVGSIGAPRSWAGGYPF